MAKPDKFKLQKKYKGYKDTQFSPQIFAHVFSEIDKLDKRLAKLEANK